MVTASIWNNDTQTYSVEVTNTTLGEKKLVVANVMFYAIGGFQRPVFSADVPGSESFKGHIWHSAQYRHDVGEFGITIGTRIRALMDLSAELKGKRVGVIGNGCSGAQLVPAIAADPSVQVTNFCRTPHWIVPRV